MIKDSTVEQQIVQILLINMIYLVQMEIPLPPEKQENDRIKTSTNNSNRLVEI